MRFESVVERRCGRWPKPRKLLVPIMVLAGCAAETPSQLEGGSLSGQVVVSGPLRGAKMSVDQIETKDPAMTIRNHVADAVTNDHGEFSVNTGVFSGLLLVTATGGTFVDSSASEATIQLDATSGLSTVVPFDLLDTRDDVLVSPVGHLIAARTRSGAAGAFHDSPEPVVAAHMDANQRLGNQFGNVQNWALQKISSLSAPATSPTEPVRAGLVHAALSELAHDIAQAAGASPQEVNVLSLTKQLAADLGKGAFDGNDGNDPSPASGLQVGICPAVSPCPPVPAGGCNLGSCRSLCDLYVGTSRTLLAAEMTKLIQSPRNRTGLITGDVLAVARAVASNVDESLFGGACIEQLDRIPPTLTWAAKPADGDFVHGTVMLTVTATDDIDLPPAPAVAILGYPDADGDPRNNIATAAINTSSMADGPLMLTAQSADMAGNSTMSMRVVQVDNTIPMLTLDFTGFLVDSGAWWTADDSATLHGTFTEAHPAGLEAIVGSTHVTGAISGSIWSVTLPAGLIDRTGADVRIVLTDAAGNQATVVQRLRYDATPPVVSFQASIVHDEAAEAPAFNTDEVPVHSHNGTPVNLDVAGACPLLTKYSYLLGANPPPYGIELGGRNPLLYHLLVADDGVGVNPGATQYRVGRDDAGGTTQWITNLLAVPPGNAQPGVTSYDVPIFADVATGLDAIEGIYRVEFQSTDRLGRATTQRRCFNLRLRAPPLHFGTLSVGSVTYTPGNATTHKFAMLALGLGQGGPFGQIAARVLNDNAASSLLDMPVINGTASPVYLTITVTQPSGVTAAQTFSRRYVTSTTSVNIDCDTGNCPGDLPPPIDDGADSPAVGGLKYPVRVYQLDANGVPTNQIPCLNGCLDVDTVFRYVIPARSVSAPPLRVLVMTMVGQIKALFPQDGSRPDLGPFSDFSVNGINLTGRPGPFLQTCTPDRFNHCRQVTNFDGYRALTSVTFQFTGPLRSAYATAAGPTLPAETIPGGPLQTSAPYTWTAAQPSLP